MDVLHEDALVLEDVTLHLHVHLVVQVLVNLLRVAVPERKFFGKCPASITARGRQPTHKNAESFMLVCCECMLEHVSQNGEEYALDKQATEDAEAALPEDLGREASLAGTLPLTCIA